MRLFIFFFTVALFPSVSFGQTFSADITLNQRLLSFTFSDNRNSTAEVWDAEPDCDPEQYDVSYDLAQDNLLPPEYYACYYPGEVVYVPEYNSSFTCPADTEVTFDNWYVGEDGDHNKCGSTAVIFWDTYRHKATIRHTCFDLDTCASYISKYRFSVPVYHVSAITTNFSETIPGLSIDPSDLQPHSDSSGNGRALPITWLHHDSSLSDNTPPDTIVNFSYYSAAVSTGSSSPDNIHLFMFDNRLCDSTAFPPDFCLTPGEWDSGATLNNGPSLNGTLTNAGIINPPNLSYFNARTPFYGKVRIGGAEAPQSHDVSAPVYLASEDTTFDIFPVSFSSEEISVSLSTCHFPNTESISYADYTRMASMYVTPSSTKIIPGNYPTLNIDGSDFSICTDYVLLPNTTYSAARQHIATSLSLPTGLHYIQLSISDDYGQSIKGMWVIVRHHPVSYVHGYGTKGHIWRAFARYLYANNYIIDTFEISGSRELGNYAPYYSDYHEERLSLGGVLDWLPITCDHIPAYEHNVGSMLAGISDRSGLPSADVIAHSMGGLVSRWHDNFRVNSNVHKLVTAGTPSHGSDYATAFALYSEIPLGPLASTCHAARADMTPHSSFLNELNGNNYDDGSVFDIYSSLNNHVVTGWRSNILTPSHRHVDNPLDANYYYSIVMQEWVEAAATLDGDGIVRRNSSEYGNFQAHGFHQNELDSSPDTNYEDCHVPGYDHPFFAYWLGINNFHGCFYKHHLVHENIEDYLLYGAASTRHERVPKSPETDYTVPTHSGNLFASINPLGTTTDIPGFTVDETTSKLTFSMFVHPAQDISATLDMPSGNTTPLVCDCGVSNEQQYCACSASIDSPETGEWHPKFPHTAGFEQQANIFYHYSYPTEINVTGSISSRFLTPGDTLYLAAHLPATTSSNRLIGATAYITDSNNNVFSIAFDDLDPGGNNSTSTNILWGVFHDTLAIGSYNVTINSSILNDDTIINRYNHLSFSVEDASDLHILPNSTIVLPTSVNYGQCASVLTQIGNNSNKAQENITASLYRIDPEGIPHHIHTVLVDPIQAGEAALVSIPWVVRSDDNLLVSIGASDNTNKELAFIARPGAEDYYDGVIYPTENNNAFLDKSDYTLVEPAHNVFSAQATIKSTSSSPILLDLGTPLNSSNPHEWRLSMAGTIIATLPGPRAILKDGLRLLDMPTLTNGAQINASFYPTGSVSSPLTTTYIEFVEQSELDNISNNSSIAAPTARINGPTTAYVGEPITFIGSSSSDNYGILSYSWTPPKYYAHPAETHRPFLSLPDGFPSAGAHFISLNVTDTSNLTSPKAFHTINIRRRPTRLYYTGASEITHEYGTPVMFSVALAQRSTPTICSSKTIPGKTVLFKLTNGTQSATLPAITDSMGVATVRVSPSNSGTTAVVAAYPGGTAFEGSTLTLASLHTSDTQPPNIYIYGVYEGERYQVAHISYFATDPNLGSVTAELNGNSVDSNSISVDSPGEHCFTVFASDTYNNDSTKTTCFTIRPPLPRPFALCATEQLTITNSSVISARIRASGQITSIGHIASEGGITMRNSATVNGSAVALGDIYLDNSSTINGDAIYGGTLSADNNSTITGTSRNELAGNNICTCGLDFEGTIENYLANNDNEKLLENQNTSMCYQDGQLIITNGNDLILEDGVYVLDKLILRNNSTLSVSVASNVSLIVLNELTIDNTSAFNFPPQNGSQTTIYAVGEQNISLDNSTVTAFNLIAPYSIVSLRNSADFIGSIIAKQIEAENSTGILRDVRPTSTQPLTYTCPQ